MARASVLSRHSAAHQPTLRQHASDAANRYYFIRAIRSCACSASQAVASNLYVPMCATYTPLHRRLSPGAIHQRPSIPPTPIYSNSTKPWLRPTSKSCDSHIVLTPSERCRHVTMYHARHSKKTLEQTLGTAPGLLPRPLNHLLLHTAANVFCSLSFLVLQQAAATGLQRSQPHNWPIRP